MVDLSGGPPLPAYAGFQDDEAFNIGSMGKMPAMYAAFELRRRVNKAATAVKAAIAAGAHVPADFWPTLFFSKVQRVWSPQVAKGFPGLDTLMPDRFPKLDVIFSVSGAGVVEFTSGTASDTAIGTLNLGPSRPTAA